MGKSARLGKRMGVGGSAEVLHAVRDGLPVAVKRLLSEAADQTRLVREAQLGVARDHPNIVSVLDLERGPGGRVHLLLEHVDGVALGQLLRVGPLPIEAAVYVAHELLAALDHIHNQGGIVHRDVSPQNVLISREGMVKLIDFEMAQPLGSTPTTGSLARGTLGYVSPEHLDEGALDQRSDLFAVGVLLYESLTAQRPFGRTRPEIIAALVNAKAPSVAALRSDLPEELDIAIAGLLERDRARRYASARDVLQALPPCPQGRRELLAFLQQKRLLAETPSAPAQSRLIVATTPARTALISALCLVLGVALGLLMTDDARHDAEPAAVRNADAPLFDVVPAVGASAWQQHGSDGIE